MSAAKISAIIFALALILTPIISAHESHKPVHRIHRRVDWHTTRLLVTEYVVDRESGCDTYPGRTASGEYSHPGSIAVDTRQFPFGTKFRIPGYGYGVADDTGGDVGWGHIDAAVVSNRHESGCDIAFDWGVRHLNVQWR